MPPAYNRDNTWTRRVARETWQREMPCAESIFVGSVWRPPRSDFNTVRPAPLSPKRSWVFLQNTNKGGTAGIYISSLSLMKGRDFFNLREGKVRIPASLLARYLSAPATPSGLAKHDARGLREGKERARETARGREAWRSELIFKERKDMIRWK